MEIQKIQNDKPRAKVALQGASGSGKSYTALLLAYGLCGAYEKVAVIETDYKSANHYSYFGAFNTLTINAPYKPEKFTDAIDLCERSGMEVVIIDTLSAEWTDIGGMQERMVEEGTECMHWHQSLLQSIQKSPCHIIAIIRSKECFHLSIRGNRQEVQKVGLDPIQQEGIHYHFHTVLSLDMNHKVKALKDRTSFFEEHSDLVITDDIAALYAKWCAGNSMDVSQDLQERINACNSIKDLLELMYQNDLDHQPTVQAFVSRRTVLEGVLDENPIFSLNKHMNNGDFNRRA
jgi:hypothetical protein